MALTRDRIRGMFLGIAIGDALGVPVEIYDHQRIMREFGAVRSYIQNSTHKWSSQKAPGTWSDDTQLTLAVAEALIEAGELNMDCMARWHLAIIDELGDLGLGNTTGEAFAKLRTGMSWSESGATTKPNRGAGNGMPMKIAPLGAYLAATVGKRLPITDLPQRIVHLTAMTHTTTVALQSAYAHTLAIVRCLATRGRLNPDRFRDTLIRASEKAYTLGLSHEAGDLTPALRNVLRNDIWTMSTEQLAKLNHGKPFRVINSLPLTYACFLRNPYNMESIYEAIAVGGDTDTNASIVGGLVGALNGTSVFPQELIDGLWKRDRILDTADQFCDKFDITT